MSSEKFPECEANTCFYKLGNGRVQKCLIKSDSGSSLSFSGKSLLFHFKCSVMYVSVSGKAFICLIYIYRAFFGSLFFHKSNCIVRYWLRGTPWYFATGLFKWKQKPRCVADGLVSRRESTYFAANALCLASKIACYRKIQQKYKNSFKPMLFWTLLVVYSQLTSKWITETNTFCSHYL